MQTDSSLGLASRSWRAARFDGVMMFKILVLQTLYHLAELLFPAFAHLARFDRRLFCARALLKRAMSPRWCPAALAGAGRRTSSGSEDERLLHCNARSLPWAIMGQGGPTRSCPLVQPMPLDMPAWGTYS